jgi:hypothetical protein
MTSPPSCFAIYSDDELRSMYRFCHHCVYSGSAKCVSAELRESVLATVNKTRKFVRDMILENPCWRMQQLVETAMLEVCEADRLEFSQHSASKQYGCMFTGLVGGNVQMQFIKAENDKVEKSVLYVMQRPFVECMEAVHVLAKIESFMEMVAMKAVDKTRCENPDEEPEFVQATRVLHTCTARVFQFTKQAEGKWQSLLTSSTVDE